MTTYDETQIVDAIHADIEANVSLGTHQSYLYVEPRALRPDVHPKVLIIHPSHILHEIISTVSNYENRNRFTISWRQADLYGMETNIGDRELARASLLVANEIRARLQTDGAGVPGLENTTAELFETKYRLDRNGFWSCDIVLQVSTFEGG